VFGGVASLRLKFDASAAVHGAQQMPPSLAETGTVVEDGVR
jgi:hypothetical protein